MKDARFLLHRRKFLNKIHPLAEKDRKLWPVTVSGFGLMFWYWQYSLHAKTNGLRSFAPPQFYGLHTGAELGSPFSLRRRCKAGQQSLRPKGGVIRIAGNWNVIGTAPDAEIQIIDSAKLRRGERSKL